MFISTVAFITHRVPTDLEKVENSWNFVNYGLDHFWHCEISKSDFVVRELYVVVVRKLCVVMVVAGKLLSVVTALGNRIS